MTTPAITTVLISLLAFIAILLGDARQHIIDVFISGIVLVAAGSLWTRKEIRRPPVTAAVAWGATFLVLIVGLFITDSIGATTQYLVRYAVAAVIFLLGFSVYSEQRAAITERVLIVLGLVISFATLVAIFVPQPSWLPPMNLLYPSYGHNHAADLLLLVLPASFSALATGRRRALIVPTVIVAGLLLTFARAAWIIGAAALMVLIFLGIARRGLFLVGVFTVFLVFGGGLWFFTERAAWSDAAITAPHIVQKFIRKSPPLEDPRWEYWRQAGVAVTERPVLGSGGGTFYFVSKRLQSRPGAFSWFAHSLPIQIFAEHGILGGIVLISLFLWVATHLARAALNSGRLASSTGRLAFGGLVTLAYATIEYNLGFMVIWCIFWVISGFALRATSDHAPAVRKPATTVPFLAPLWVIGAYYALLTIQNAVFAFAPKRTDLAFYVSPFDQTAALAYLTSPGVSDRGIQLAKTFHRKDPDVISAIGDVWNTRLQQPRAKAAYALALELDSRTEERHRKYLSYLLSTKDYDSVVEWLRVWPTVFFPSSVRATTFDLYIDREYVESREDKIHELFNARFSHEVRYARFFYDAGLWYLPKNPTKTRALWKQASLLTPALSDLWVERAALEHHVFRDVAAADAILVACAENPVARRHCAIQRVEGWLPPPGSYRDGIMTK